MQLSLSVLNSDAVNKYGYSITLQALHKALWEHALTGVPMHLGHDMHKPIGWILPFGLFLQPKLCRVLGRQIIPDTIEEQAEMNETRKAYFANITLRELEKYEPNFLPLIQQHLSPERKFLQVSALSALDNNIVQKVFPTLSGNLDKDGLLYLKDLLADFEYKGQGTFTHKYSPLCIYAHSYFRRSLSRHNNFHFFFLDELISYTTNPEVSVRIAIDWDLIGYSPSWLPAQELEYWFGPKYNDEISSITPGLTKHVTSEYERLYYGISATEFFWKTNEDLHEFELEELKEDEAPTLTDSYACRYIHSIYNRSHKTFQHFDGAIRSYNTETYMERIDKKMTEAGRRSEYKKLFRIDGKLKIGSWKSLSTNYLQGNPLIYEYFGLEKPEVKTILNKSIVSAKKQLIPYCMNNGDGIRMFLSYHQANTTLVKDRVVSISDMMTIDNNKVPFIEYDIIEIKKALNRLGGDLIIPDDWSLVAFEDLYWNIPCIFHGRKNCQRNLNLTVQAFRNILTALHNNKNDKVITFTLAWNMEDKEIRLSFMGHSNDLFKWIQQVSSIPTDHLSFNGWLENQYKFLSNSKVDNPFLPPLEEISKLDGVLFIFRRMVEPKFNLQFVQDDNGLQWQIDVPDNSDLANAVASGDITIAVCCVIKKIKCSKSGKNYWQSDYSKILDHDVHTIVEDIELVQHFWTDKPA